MASQRAKATTTKANNLYLEQFVPSIICQISTYCSDVCIASRPQMCMKRHMMQAALGTEAIRDHDDVSSLVQSEVREHQNEAETKEKKMGSKNERGIENEANFPLYFFFTTTDLPRRKTKPHQRMPTEMSDWVSVWVTDRPTNRACRAWPRANDQRSRDRVNSVKILFSKSHFHSFPLFFTGGNLPLCVSCGLHAPTHEAIDTSHRPPEE